MHSSGTNGSPENGNMANVPLRSVLTLSDRQAILLDVPQPAGVPDREFKKFLDAYGERTGYARHGVMWPEKSCANVLRRIAAEREPSREFEADPLLWMLRVWWNIREATLSYVALQSGGGVHTPFKAEERFTGTEVSYRAMAAWAHRQWDGDELLHSLCDKILDGVRGREFKDDPLPDYETGHRLLWCATAGGYDRREAFDLAVEAKLFPISRA